MIQEKDFINYLENNNNRFVFIIPNKDKLPTIEEIEQEITFTGEIFNRERYGYWQSVKDFASLHILLTIVKAYNRAVKHNIDITVEILDSLKSSNSPVPFGTVFANNFAQYVREQRDKTAISAE
jgi:hypothetical protein